MATDPPATIPTTTAPVSAEDQRLLNDYTDAWTRLGQSEGTVASITSTVGDVFSQLSSKVSSYARNLSNLTELNAAQTEKLGALIAGTIRYREAFTSLVGVDTSNLTTFNEQLEDIKRALFSGGTAASDAMASINRLATALHGHKIGSDLMREAAAKGTVAVVDLARNMLAGADNALRLQNSIVQLSANTGTLDDVLGATGEGFKNINSLTEQYQQSLTATEKATHLSAAQVEAWYGALGNVPGALTSVVKGGADMNSNVSTLTATIQYATGSGRKMADVVDDMKTAFRDYGIVGEPALQFTARMGELSNKFHIELDDVRNALRSTADNFKMFGNEAEGAAKMMNQYLGALESTGLSGRASVEVIQGMTDGVKNLNIAQKAFLSAQTGGPGGLMGAFQIEKLLRDGKIDQVFDKVRQTMTRQFGNIVTLDEATKSPQAAAQLTKQMMILRQGPLGHFAKDDQSAMRILQAFTTKGSVKDLSKTIVQEKIAGGKDLEVAQSSLTELTKIREGIDAMRGVGSGANLRTLQRLRDVDQLRKYSNAAARESGNIIGEGGETGLSGEIARRQITNLSGPYAANLLRNSEMLGKETANAVKKSFHKIEDYLRSGKTEEAQIEAAKIDEEMRQRQSNMQKYIGTVPPIDLSDITEPNAAGQLGSIARGIAAKGGGGVTTRGAAVTGLGGGTHAIADSGRLGEIVVHVEGYCLDCGEKMKGTTQSFAVNTGQKARK